MRPKPCQYNTFIGLGAEIKCLGANQTPFYSSLRRSRVYLVIDAGACAPPSIKEETIRFSFEGSLLQDIGGYSWGKLLL